MSLYVVSLICYLSKQKRRKYEQKNKIGYGWINYNLYNNNWNNNKENK